MRKFAADCLSSTLDTNTQKENFLQRSQINTEAPIRDLLRDFSSACCASQQMESFSLLYNPVCGSIDLALSNHHNSQTMRRQPGTGFQYKQIFYGIERPNYAEDTQYHQHELEQLADSRFYIAIKGPSGYSFKLEVVDAGKIYSIDREVSPFPTLSEIIRLQLHRGLEEDAVCRTRELIYNSTRWEFLQGILYPEISSQLDLFLTKFKLSTQLAIATRERNYRVIKSAESPRYHSSDANNAPPHTSFSELTDDGLSAWIEQTKSFVNDRKLKLSPTEPRLNLTPPDVFTIPVNQKTAFRYTFVRHDNRVALPTAFLIAKARNFRKQASYISALIHLSKICPHKVCPIASPNEFEMENINCVRSLLCFLSYGFFDALNYN